MSEWYTGAFAQDTWKITPRLTLNAGVRWEPYFPQQIRNGYIYDFTYSRFLANQGSMVYVNAPPGFTYPGDPGFIGNSGVNPSYGNFAPRVGLAWDPKGDGRMTIRASWGMAYDFVNGQFNINTSIAPPFGQQTTVTPGTTYSFDNPWATFPGGNSFPVVLNKNIVFASGGSFLVNNSNQKNTAVNSWNLTVQKQVGSSWLFSGSYIGNEAEPPVGQLDYRQSGALRSRHVQRGSVWTYGCRALLQYRDRELSRAAFVHADQCDGGTIHRPAGLLR